MLNHFTTSPSAVRVPEASVVCLGGDHEPSVRLLFGARRSGLQIRPIMMGVWLPLEESNLDSRIQSPLSYR